MWHVAVAQLLFPVWRDLVKLMVFLLILGAILCSLSLRFSSEMSADCYCLDSSCGERGDAGPPGRRERGAPARAGYLFV